MGERGKVNGIRIDTHQGQHGWHGLNGSVSVVYISFILILKSLNADTILASILCTLCKINLKEAKLKKSWKMVI